MDNKKIIIILLCVIIALLVVGLALMMQTSSNDSISESDNADNATTNPVNSEETNDDGSPHSISIVPEFDKNVKKTVGEYTLEATKWRGSSFGGFGVLLYKNGELMDRYSYESRAYFCMDGEWKWSNWDYGEEDAVYHKYPVSNDVDIQEVEVRF